MSNDDKTFDWVDLPGGRARFSGGVRGADEAGHDTFAVELDGRTYYGEVRRLFLSNGNDFNLEILSFGWPGQEWIGMPMPGLCHPLSEGELETARTLIVGLVQAAQSFDEKPGPLVEYPDARFMGRVVFRQDWALVDRGGVSA